MQKDQDIQFQGLLTYSHDQAVQFRPEIVKIVCITLPQTFSAVQNTLSICTAEKIGLGGHLPDD